MTENIPVIRSDKDPQGSELLMENLIKIQVISSRIQEDKQKFIDTIGKDIVKNNEALNMLKLDILSLFIFADMYIDYLVRYINKNYFPDIEGLSDKSFINHIKSAEDIIDDNLIFNDYKNYLLDQGMHLYFKLGNLKIVTKNWFTGLREDIIYDLEASNYYLIFWREKSYDLYFDDGVEKVLIDTQLEKEIVMVAKKYNIDSMQDMEGKFSRLIYLDKIMKMLEFKFNLSVTITEESYKKISKKHRVLIDLRKKLGIIFIEKNFFQFLIDFTIKIRDILNRKLF